MKRRPLFVVLSVFLSTPAGFVAAQTPAAFTYQGRLTGAGNPANGTYDLRFTLFDAPAAGSIVAGPATLPGVAVTQGLFTVSLDFGTSPFSGQARWLEIEVQLTGGGGYTTLSPRQALTPSPYSVFSSYTNPLNLTSLNASNLTSGTVPDARLAGAYSQALSLSSGANAITGTFTGDGFALTNLNASNLAVGVVPDGRLAGTYSNPMAFSSPANVFTGDGSGLTNLNAQPKYVRTVVVSPVGTQAANGTRLLSALAGITTASAGNPWLLKIEPGIYDVGTTSFVMKPFVDVEGSGERVTRITGQGSASNGVGTVQAVSNSELRFLMVENTGGAPYAKALFVDNAAPRVTHVTALGSGGSSESQGFFAQNGATPTVSDLTASGSATGSANSFGVLNVGASPVMFNVNAFSNGGTVSRAVEACCGAAPLLRNVVAIASGGTQENQGVANYDSSPTMENVVAIASGTAVNNLGVLNFGATTAPSMRLVACRAIGATGINWGCLTNGSAHPTMVDITAEAVGGTTARALENSPAGAGLSLTRVRAVASGASGEVTGFFNDSSAPQVNDLEVFANGGGSATTTGIFIQSGSPSLSHVTVSVGGTTTDTMRGIVTASASGTNLSDAVVTVSASGAAITNGIWSNNSSPILTDVVASASGSAAGSTHGVASLNANVTMTNVTATASAAGGTIAGIRNNDSTVRLTNVTGMATGAAGNRYGLWNSSDLTPNTVTADRCSFSAATDSVRNDSGTAQIGVSRLIGPVFTAGGSTTSCLFSYNGAYAALNAACQ